MAGGAAIDGGLAHDSELADCTVDGNVRRHLTIAKLFDEAGHIISLVGAERDAAITPAPVQHAERRLALRRPGGMRQGGIDRQPIAVLHQHIPYEAQPALAAVRLAIKPCIGIGGRGMRLVRAYRP